MSRAVSTYSNVGTPAWMEYLSLAKPRLVSLVMLSVGTGFYLGSGIHFSIVALLWTLTGAFLVGCGAMGFNEWLERDVDAKMERTQHRPLPAGRLSARQALFFSWVTSTMGLILLGFAVNPLCAGIAFATLTSYIFIYTPLKRKTSLATIAGAVPGALPVLIGWAAATGRVSFSAMLIFLIVFFWQMPHFLSIAWMYRDDYKRAGLPMLSVIDESGFLVARQMIVYVCALLPVSLLPTLFGIAGQAYFFLAFVLGLSFSSVIIFSATNLDMRARHVLRASIIYLSLIFLTLMVDKL